MTGTVSIVRPTETFTLDKGLPEEFLKQNEHGAKETPENREEKLQELLRMINALSLSYGERLMGMCET
ncbi:hypothetical protein RUM43_009011 [Polyplax serrata]|uniref:Uncharacterized protein n=1 Tax=Polyplax serrata TaxID=468196 RepID=A0AAN8PVS8_POLSC